MASEMLSFGSVVDSALALYDALDAIVRQHGDELDPRLLAKAEEALAEARKQ